MSVSSLGTTNSTLRDTVFRPHGIILFVDGTGCDLFRSPLPSNISILHRHLESEDKTVFYHRGVGVSEYDGSMNRFVDGVGGYSLEYSMKTLYSILIDNYKPGA
eukprot:1006714-Amorphochlora_amoeboformis.AAC.1